MKRLAEDDSGEFVGIGASVSKNTETGQVYVVKPLKDSPAEAAGIQPGDVFVEVDGITITKEMELDEVVTYVRGTKDSVAKIKMYREGESDFLNFEITRKLLQNITCEYEMLSNGFGYIEVEEFIDNTAEQFYKAVDDLVAQGAKALIVDMRNNPGGFTVVATNMVDYLLEDTAVPKGQGSDKAGVLLEIKDKNGKIIEKDVCQDGHSVDLPMAVLVNDYTASSSEIFSGAMRDYGKAILVGEKTYGKGIVQQVFSLNDGSGVKLTIASYFLPAGDNIHKVGIEPDVEVELPTELRRKANLLHSEDTQLQKAITELGGDPLPEGE
jgi:carboxyl-terminal processing protease